MKYGVLVVLVFVVASMPSMVLADASCLTASENNEIRNLAANTNTSEAVLLSIFESICNDIEERVSDAEFNSSLQIEGIRIEQRLDNRTSQIEITVLQKVEEKLSNISTRFENEFQLIQILNSFAQTLNQSGVVQLRDEVNTLKYEMDTRFENLPDKFVPIEEFITTKERLGQQLNETSRLAQIPTPKTDNTPLLLGFLGVGAFLFWVARTGGKSIKDVGSKFSGFGGFRNFNPMEINVNSETSRLKTKTKEIL